MNRYLYTLVVLIALFLGGLTSTTISAENSEGIVDCGEGTAYLFDLRENLYQADFLRAKKAIKEAQEQQVNFFVIRIDCAQGDEEAADSLYQLLSTSELRTVAFVERMATSMGAYAAISCDSIYMHPNAYLGAVTAIRPPDFTGKRTFRLRMKDKMEALAKTKGRDAEIAMAMADEDVIVNGIPNKGFPLMISSEDALDMGYSDGEFEEIESVLERLSVATGSYTRYKVTVKDQLLNFLLHPFFSFILLMVIWISLFNEFKYPGLGIPILVALVASILLLVPLYIDGRAADWEIVLFSVGFLLLLAEMYIIPGFGVPGIAGIILLIGAIVLALLGNDYFDFSTLGSFSFQSAVIMVMASISVAVVALVFFAKHFLDSTALNRLAHTENQTVETGYSIKDLASDRFIGKIGEAQTDLRIAGKISIDGEIHDAISQGIFIDKGTAVIVLENRGNYLLVKPSSQS
ncbi:hypothetical protein N8482_01590 [Chitinophagales bacterium]|nr:hypothetical protein [Chitinophagales bacterium]